jgi:hypothetical protein
VNPDGRKHGKNEVDLMTPNQEMTMGNPAVTDSAHQQEHQLLSDIEDPLVPENAMTPY